MKAVSFQKGLELQLLVDGESWVQGSVIRGKLTIKSHSAVSEKLSAPTVTLALGDLKRVQKGASDGFTILSQQSFATPPLEPKQNVTLAWEFALEPNCSITDSGQSLYLLFSLDSLTHEHLASATQLPAHIQLNVVPLTVVQELVKLLEITFRFIPKTQKFDDGAVVTKLAPPSSKEFAMIEYLFLETSLNGKDLGVTYRFQIKKIDAAVGSMKLKKETKVFTETYTPSQLTTESGRFNHDRMKDLVAEVLFRVANKIVFE